MGAQQSLPPHPVQAPQLVPQPISVVQPVVQQPIPAPPTVKMAQPPLEQRCIACLNYHYHDHPSVLAKGANFQTFAYPADSPRDKFDGIMIANVPEWFGRLTFRSGAAYEGGFRAGEFNGFGHYVVENQYEYLGGWNDGKKEGFGREVKIDVYGAREEYVGGWKDDQRHGEGWINGRDWVRYYMGSQVPNVTL